MSWKGAWPVDEAITHSAFPESAPDAFATQPLAIMPSIKPLQRPLWHEPPVGLIVR